MHCRAWSWRRFFCWFGLGIWSKVALGVTVVFFVVFFNSYQGVREVDPVLLQNARMWGASERDLLRHVIVPSALGWIFSSMHVSIGFAIISVVVGEYLESAKGIGYVIAQAEGVFDTMMRRREAMAQSWIADPDIILMDEPFGALDVQTRMRMQAELLRLWGGSCKTALLVTHDLEEAIALSDEVAILPAGPCSHVAARYAVDLRRPRNAIDIRMEARFAEIYRTVWNVLRTEVLKSHA
jgi:hypothetical protein